MARPANHSLGDVITPGGLRDNEVELTAESTLQGDVHTHVVGLFEQRPDRLPPMQQRGNVALPGDTSGVVAQTKIDDSKVVSIYPNVEACEDF